MESKKAIDDRMINLDDVSLLCASKQSLKKKHVGTLHFQITISHSIIAIRINKITEIKKKQI